jgi:hypothetical protein
MVLVDFLAAGLQIASRKWLLFTSLELWLTQQTWLVSPHFVAISYIILDV